MLQLPSRLQALLHADLHIRGVGKTAALGLSGAGATIGIATVSPTIAGGIGFAGALYFVGTTLGSCKAIVRQEI